MLENMKEFGLVSVIMPSYKCGKFISESIKSVQCQTYQNWELIIVDDCSGDGTVQIVESFQKNDQRIRLLQNETNSGAALSRNYALREAKGRWIAFLDSDDLWKPEKLEHQLEFMASKGYAFSYHDVTWYNESMDTIEKYQTGKRHVSVFSMYCCCWPGCLTVMYDSSVVGQIQIADIKKNNDSAMWLKIIKKADCHLLKENLASYRHRAGSITPPDLRTKIKWHYILFREADGQSTFVAFSLTILNIVGNIYKKMFYFKYM